MTEWHTYDDELYEAYQTCQKRGHQPSGFRTGGIPPMDQCKHCGSYFWTERANYETRTPRPAAEQPPEEKARTDRYLAQKAKQKG